MRPVAFALGLFLLAAPASADEPAPPPTAWGRPVGGLQLGLRLLSVAAPKGDGLANLDAEPGAVVELEVVVRNVGRGGATIQHPTWGKYRVWSDERDGVVTSRGKWHGGGFGGVLVKTRLAPGAEKAVGYWPVVRRTPGFPNLNRALVGPPPTELAPGTYRIGVDRFELWAGDDPVAVELGTGYLDVKVPAAK